MKRAVLFLLCAGCDWDWWETPPPHDSGATTEPYTTTTYTYTSTGYTDTTTGYTTGSTGYTTTTGYTDTGAIACTGTRADLEATLEVRDLNGDLCTSCVDNAELTLVITNPCPDDVTIDIDCDPGSGGFVEGWEVTQPNGAGRGLSYGCDFTNPLQIVVPGNGSVQESFLWDPALDPGEYRAKAYLLQPSGFFKVRSGDFEVL